MGLSLTINASELQPVLNRLSQQSPEEVVLKGWGQNADELLEIEKFNVQQRIQDRTHGPDARYALDGSVQGRAYQNTQTGTLISIWYNPAPQLAMWNRNYAAYQEGPPLGLSTYTNEPRHMLADARSADQPDPQQIFKWAIQRGQKAVNEYTSGLGE